MEVLFSFGSSEQFPFQGGYIIINASNKIAAVEEFRRLYPDIHPGILNCSDDPNLIKDFKKFRNTVLCSVIGKCDEFLYLGGNESSTHEYVSKMLEKDNRHNTTI
mgnify:FL=1